MPFSVKELLLGVATPALIAMVLGWLIAFVSRSTSVTRHLLPVTFVAAFLTGYWLLGLGPVLPKLDRDWTPYVAVAALPAALVPGRGWRGACVKIGLTCLAVGLIAWWIVPAWPTLEPSRETHLAIWITYACGLAIAMLLLGFRLAGSYRRPSDDTPNETPEQAKSRGGVLWLIMMAGASLAAFGMLPMTGSLRFALIAGASFGAMAGILAAYWFTKQKPSLDGVAIVYAMLISGIMLTAKVNSFSGIPIVCYGLLPLAPLAIGILPVSPDKPLTIGNQLLALSVAVAISGTAFGIALYSYFSTDDGYSRRPLLRDRFPQQGRLIAMQVNEALSQPTAIIAGRDS